MIAVVKSAEGSSSNICEQSQHSNHLGTMSKDQHLRDLLLEKTSEVQKTKADIEK